MDFQLYKLVFKVKNKILFCPIPDFRESTNQIANYLQKKFEKSVCEEVVVKKRLWV
jgi:hypothetical protein